MSLLERRRARLSAARLYLICDATPGGRPLESVLAPALRGGVDVFQLRCKDASDEEILAAAAVAREWCEVAGALFILNDRPDLVAATGADGVHVGQDDVSVARGARDRRPRRARRPVHPQPRAGRRRRGRRLHRRRPGPHDADQARPSRRRPRAGHLRGAQRQGAVVCDRRRRRVDDQRRDGRGRQPRRDRAGDRRGSRSRGGHAAPGARARRRPAGCAAQAQELRGAQRRDPRRAGSDRARRAAHAAGRRGRDRDPARHRQPRARRHRPAAAGAAPARCSSTAR